jgi:hypothetical protein
MISIAKYTNSDFFKKNWLELISKTLAKILSESNFQQAILLKGILNNKEKIIYKNIETDKVAKNSESYEYYSEDYIGKSTTRDSTIQGLDFKRIQELKGFESIFLLDRFEHRKVENFLYPVYSSGGLELILYDYNGNKIDYDKEKFVKSIQNENILKILPKIEEIYNKFYLLCTKLNIAVIEDSEAIIDIYEIALECFGKNLIKPFKEARDFLEEKNQFSRINYDKIVSDYLTESVRDVSKLFLNLRKIREKYPCSIDVLSGKSEPKVEGDKPYDQWIRKSRELSRTMRKIVIDTGESIYQRNVDLGLVKRNKYLDLYKSGVNEL